MPEPTIDELEQTRVALLRSYRILDTPHEEAFDAIARDVKEALKAPYTSVIFFDESRAWLKAACGVAMSEVPRASTIAARILTENLDQLAIANAEADVRSEKSFSVIGPQHVRSFAGVPIIGETNLIIGAVTAGDVVERQFSEQDLRFLRFQAAAVVDILSERKSTYEELVESQNYADEFREVQELDAAMRAVVSQLNHEMLQDFGWWAVQPWLKHNETFIPSTWDTAEHTPPSLKILDGTKFDAVSVQATGVSYGRPTMVDLKDLTWVSNQAQLKKLGARKVVIIDFYNSTDVAVRLLFVVPSVHSLTTAAENALAVATSLVPRVLVREITRAELNIKAQHDDLTGLLNRRGLEQLTGTHNSNPHLARAVLFLDLDKFKEVNDSYGHALGDEVLQYVAQVIQKIIRPVDSVARVGGDEFVVVTANSDRHGELESISTRIVRTLAKPHSFSNGVKLALPISIGGSYWNPGTTFTEVLHEADTRMYAVKAQGGGVKLQNIAEIAGFTPDLLNH